MNFTTPLRSQLHLLGQVRVKVGLMLVLQDYSNLTSQMNPASSITKGARATFSMKASLHDASSERDQSLVYVEELTHFIIEADY
jgi:hypothetical protein